MDGTHDILGQDPTVRQLDLVTDPFDTYRPHGAWTLDHVEHAGDYLDTLLRDRERIRAATELDDWARAEAMPSDAEITRLRQLIRRVEHDLDALDDNDRRQIEEAVRIVRATRQTVHLGLPTTQLPALDPNLEGQP